MPGFADLTNSGMLVVAACLVVESTETLTLNDPRRSRLPQKSAQDPVRAAPDAARGNNIPPRLPPVRMGLATLRL